MRVEQAINIDDLRRMAKRRLPKIAFDFIEGGLEDELGLARNETAFSRHSLVPRYLVDVSRRDQTRELFGRTYDSPFGIAPTGIAGLFRPGADLMLAEAAATANIPFIMSGASTASIEQAARIAPDHTWYQLYAAADMAICEDMIRRARDAGLGGFVVTVDVPVSSKRERNLRNGFSSPLKLTPSIVWDGLTHPFWLIDYLRAGQPVLENWAPYAGGGVADSARVQAFYRTQQRASQTWRELEAYRRLWPRKLVVKGILHPDDARRCAEIGVDGIMVSNHGGRQLDRAPSPLEVLPAIRAAVGDRLTLMLDSGVRRGADILTALCLGAQFVFVGRATLYGAAAGGLAGVRRAIEILRGEIDTVQGQIGCPSLDRLGPDFLMSGIV
jgi:L-lactate dehydrogenase (cytochrome)/(S)-mandelate dehydrogenase